MESDNYDRELARKYFGFENEFSLVFSLHTGSDDDALIIRAMQNILRIALAFAAEPAI